MVYSENDKISKYLPPFDSVSQTQLQLLLVFKAKNRIYKICFSNRKNNFISYFIYYQLVSFAEI